MRRVEMFAALVIVMAIAVPVAGAQEGPASSDSAAERIDRQIGSTTNARERIWAQAHLTDDSSDPIDMTVKGTFNLDRMAFLGRVHTGLVTMELYSTTTRVLGRLPGTKCWKAVKGKGMRFSSLATLALGSSDPRLWEHDGAVGPPVFSIKSPQQVQWTMGGSGPVTSVETYNPATMLPLQTDTVQSVAATATDPAYTRQLTTRFRFSRLSWKPPQKPKRCR